MKLISRYVNLTPTELFKLQVSGTMDKLRSRNTGLDFIPPQFGGIEGQRITLQESEVMEVTTFKGDS